MRNNIRFLGISVLLAIVIGVIGFKVEPFFFKESKAMHKIVIYSTTTCPYCVRAKDLLNRKGAKYTEYLVDSDMSKREEMLHLSGGRRTVPQIFINDKHIGGCDDLYQLDAEGKLDEMLKQP